jgi:hypothetical protein
MAIYLPPRNPNFVGRVQLLHNIQEGLDARSEVLLDGLCGVG